MGAAGWVWVCVDRQVRQCVWVLWVCAVSRTLTAIVCGSWAKIKASLEALSRARAFTGGWKMVHPILPDCVHTGERVGMCACVGEGGWSYS